MRLDWNRIRKKIWQKFHLVMLIATFLVAGVVTYLGSFFESFAPNNGSSVATAFDSVLRFNTGFHDSSLPLELTWSYREGPERKGAHELGYLPLDLHETWRTKNLNIGVHTASKSSPAVDSTGIYVGADSGWFYHFASTGDLVWKYHTDNAQRGIHGSALLDNSYVYFGSYNGYFYCLQKSDGRLIWKVRLADAIGTSAVSDGQAIYVAAESNISNGALYKLDPRSGEILWRTIWFGEQVHSSPTLDLKKNQIYIGANNGEFYAFRISDGSLVWKVALGGAIKSTAALEGEKLFVSSWTPAIFCIDSGTGKILWQTPLKTVSQSSPTLVPNFNIVFVGSHRADSELYGLKKTTGEIVWREPTQTLNSQGSGVAVQTSKGRWVVWSQCRNQHLCAFDPLTGRVLKVIELSEALTSVPTVFENSLYLTLDRGPLIKLN